MHTSDKVYSLVLENEHSSYSFFPQDNLLVVLHFWE